MLNLPFNLILMQSSEWERQVSSRVNRALKEFIEACFHSPNGIDLEFQDGLTETRMYEIVAKVAGKKRFRKKKKVIASK